MPAKPLSDLVAPDWAQALAPVESTVARWDERARDVRVERVTGIGSIVLKASPVDDPDAARRALVDGVRTEGLALLPRLGEAATLRARLSFCRTHLGDEWPDVMDPALVGSLDDWLAPELLRTAARRRNDLPGPVDHSLPLPKRLLKSGWTWAIVALTLAYTAALFSQYFTITADVPVTGGVIPGINSAAIRRAAWLALPTHRRWRLAPTTRKYLRPLCP